MYFLICKVIFSDILFFDYQGLSLQAVLFVVPKNYVSESSVTNTTCEVECTESFSSIQVNQYQEYEAHVEALG